MCVYVCTPTDRLVFDGGAGHAEVQLAVLLDAGIDQSLHGALVLEQQEGVSCTNMASLLMLLRTSEQGSHWNKYLNCRSDGKVIPLKTDWETRQKNESVITLKQTFGREIGFALCFMRPVYKQVPKTPETGCYLI